MLRVTLRDLQRRRRRFVITILGTSLVFPLTLLLTKIHCCGGRRPRMFARSKSKQFGGPVSVWVPATRQEVRVVNFSVLPPEINSLLMFSGAGSGPMLDAAAAW